MLPAHLFRLHLPSALGRVCNTLRSRDQGLRDAARSVVAQISAVLGPKYLHYVIEELRSVLSEGFASHVLGYVVNSVLDAVRPAIEAAAASSSSDEDAEQQSEAAVAFVECLPSIMAIIMDDVAGRRAEERSDDSGYKPKVAAREARVCKSYDSYELVATCIPFLPNEAIHAIVAPLVAALESGRRTAK